MYQDAELARTSEGHIDGRLMFLNEALELTASTDHGLPRLYSLLVALEMDAEALSVAQLQMDLLRKIRGRRSRRKRRAS